MTLPRNQASGIVPAKDRPLRVEILSSITHAVGVGLSIAGSIILVSRALVYGDLVQIISFSVFGASLVLLYTASTIYHGAQRPEIRRVYKILDHAAIFLLIAGSYTPFLLVGIQGSRGWIFLTVVWSLALLGVGFKVFFIQRLQRFSVLFYVGLGWMSVIMFNEMQLTIPVGGLVWLGIGGGAYTFGVIFYLLQKTPYMHVIWHLFVLAGSACHYLAVLMYLAPPG